MNHFKITCSCGATFELKYETNLCEYAESMFRKFMSEHTKCLLTDMMNDDCGDPLAADPDLLNRLDEQI